MINLESIEKLIRVTNERLLAAIADGNPEIALRWTEVQSNLMHLRDAYYSDLIEGADNVSDEG